MFRLTTFMFQLSPFHVSTNPISNVSTRPILISLVCTDPYLNQCITWQFNTNVYIPFHMVYAESKVVTYRLWAPRRMNEWMKSYIAHVSSRRLFRALYIESNLARPVIIQIPTQSPGRYTAELPLRRIKLFSFQANSPYVPSTHTLWIFWGLAGWKLRLRPLRFFYVQL